MIVVIVLGIIAAIAVVFLAGTTDDAIEAAVNRNEQLVRAQIGYYTSRHDGRPPHLDENGDLDPENLIPRLTGRTDPDGRLNPDGPCQALLSRWPVNLFWKDDAATAVTFGTSAPPTPQSATAGWYYNTQTSQIYAIGPKK